MADPADPAPPPPDSACWAKAKAIFLENILSSKKRPSQESIDRFLREDFRLDKAILKCQTLKTAAENQYNKGKGSRFVGKLLEVLVMVKQVADPFLEFAPESVSIAWSAVSFLIQVGASDLENCGLIAEACTAITTVILNCRLYENRYSQASNFDAGDKDTEIEIMNAIPGLLSLVLEFSWYIQNRLSEHKILRSFKETFNPKLKDKYEEIQEEYKKLRQIAGDAFQERVMDMMDQLSKHGERLRNTLFPALEDIKSKLEEISEIKQILSESQIREQFLRNRATLSPNSIHESQLNLVLIPLNHETEHLCQWLFRDDYYLKWETNPSQISGDDSTKAAEAAILTISVGFESQKADKNDGTTTHIATTKAAGDDSGSEDSEEAEEKPPRICYIKGRPGFGKSVTVACALSRLAKPDRKSSVCYFFFRKGDESTQTSRQALLSLACQIFSEKFANTKSDMEKFNALIERAWHTIDESSAHGEVAEGSQGTSMLSNTVLKTLIQDLCKTHKKPIYIILDAIDECVDYESEELIPWLLQLARSSESNIKVLFSSRDSLGLETLLGGGDSGDSDEAGGTAPEGGDISEIPSKMLSSATSASDENDDDDDDDEEEEEDEDEDEDDEDEDSENSDDESEDGGEDDEAGNGDGEEGINSIAKRLDDSIVLTVTEKTNSEDMDSYLENSLTKLINRRMVNYKAGARKTIDVSRMVEGIKKKANGMFTYSAMVIASLGQPSSFSLGERLKRLPDGMDELYKRRLESLTMEERKLVTLALKRIVFGLGDIGTVEIAEQFKQFYEKEEDNDDDDENHFDLISHAATSTVGGHDEDGDKTVEKEETEHLQASAEGEAAISIIDENEDVDKEDLPVWQKSLQNALNNPEVADTIYHLEQAGRDFFQFSAEKKTMDVIHKSVRDWVENEAIKAAERDSNKVALNSLFTWDEKTQSLRLSMPIPTNLMHSNNFVDFQSERDTHLEIAIYNLKVLNHSRFKEQYMPDPTSYTEAAKKTNEEAQNDEGYEGEGEGEQEGGEGNEEDEGEGVGEGEEDGQPDIEEEDDESKSAEEPSADLDGTAATEDSPTDGSDVEGNAEEMEDTGSEDNDSYDEDTATETASAVEGPGVDRKALGYVDSGLKNSHRYEVVHWGEHLKKVEELFSPSERVGQKWDILWAELTKFFRPETFNVWTPHWFQYALGESIEESVTKELPPIHLVAYWGLTMVMEHLLKVMNVDPNQQDGDGDTPLIAAYTRVDLVELLLKHKADVSARATDGRTCLQLICSHTDFASDEIDLESSQIQNLIKIATLLIEAGSDINDKKAMPNERPPFFTALAAGDLDFFNLFMNHGVDVNQTDLNASTPLHKVWVPSSTASMEDRAKMAEDLIKAGATVNAEDIDSAMPLSLAVLHQNKRGVELLLEHGAEIHDEDTGGFQVIHDASSPLTYEDDETAFAIIDILVQKGADVKCLAKSGKTPIMIALQDKHIAIFDHLIKILLQQDSSGAEHLVNYQMEGENLFHTATRISPSKTGVEGAKALTKHLSGEQVLEMLSLREPERSKTPLLLAAFFERLELTQYYMELGADILSEDVDGFNVLRLIFDDWLVKSFLLSPPKDITVREEMMISLINSHPELIKDNGDAILRGAISRRAVPLVSALINAGVSTMGEDETGWNCMDLAIGTGFTAEGFPTIQSAIDEYRSSSFESKEFTNPTRMSATKKSKYIEVSESGLEVNEPDLPTEFSDIDKQIDAAVVFADSPISPKVDVFYFEVTVHASDPTNMYIAVGLVADPCPTDRTPGLAYSNTTSYGWHGDDGLLYTSRAPGSWYSFASPMPFKQGDVIGCGHNKVLREVFFTRNGEYIGVGWGPDMITGERLWPAIGAKSLYRATVNFGATPFVWTGLEDLRSTAEKAKQEATTAAE